MSIEQDIFTALNTASITAYPAEAPQGATRPYVVYRRISTMPHATLTDGEGSIDQARIQFNCYGNGYGASKTLAASVKAALVAGFGARAVKLHESDETEDGKNWIWLDYSIWKKR